MKNQDPVSDFRSDIQKSKSRNYFNYIRICKPGRKQMSYEKVGQVIDYI